MKNKGRHITAFYLETLLLVAIFVAMILVLTSVFGMGKKESLDAKHLTGAVRLAENTAEMATASGNYMDFFEDIYMVYLPDGRGGDGGFMWESEPERGSNIKRLYLGYDDDLQPTSLGSYQVQIDWVPEETEAGVLNRVTISVHYGKNPRTEISFGDPFSWEIGTPVIYTLETAVFTEGGEE